MTLQASGAISLSDLRGEFGGSAPDTLDEYYRGGSMVPDTAANAGIPASGAIALSDFYSGDASRLNKALQGTTINMLSIVFGSTATCTLRLTTAGDIIESSTGSGTNDRGDWFVSGATSADYQVLVTVAAGSLDSGVTGSYQTMSANREWSISQTTIGSKFATLTVRIRRIADTSDLVEFTVGLSASYETPF